MNLMLILFICYCITTTLLLITTMYLVYKYSKYDTEYKAYKYRNKFTRDKLSMIEYYIRNFIENKTTAGVTLDSISKVIK